MQARETRYHVSIAEPLRLNLYSQIAEFVRRPRTMLKIFFFIGGHKFFLISPGIKLLHDRGTKPIHLFVGEAKFGTGETISANLLTGEATGEHLTGALGLGVLKGCVRYIFASLFCMSKREHLRNKKKCFLFHFESSSRS